MLSSACAKGVLVRGKQVIAGASQALALLREKKAPHLFLPNGGGYAESRKAAELTSLLQQPCSADQVRVSKPTASRLRWLLDACPPFI